MWAGTRARACILLYAKGEQCAREAINTKTIHLHLWESVCFRMGVVGGGFICRWWCRIRTCRRIPDSLIPLVSLLTAFAPRCFPPAISRRSRHPTPLCTLLRSSSDCECWQAALGSPVFVNAPVRNVSWQAAVQMRQD
jgi:hypothetical protein